TVFFVVMSRSSFLRRFWPPERDDSLSKSSTKVTREETNVRAFLSFVSLLQRFPALQASRTYQHPTSVGPPRLDQAGRVRFKSQQEYEGRSPSFFMPAKGRASRPGLECRSLGVDAAVLEQPGTDCAHAALVCRGEVLKRCTGVERREELAVLIFAPRLPRLGRHLRAPALEALDTLQSGCGFVEGPNDQGTLIGALGGKDFAGFRIDAIGEAANDC